MSKSILQINCIRNPCYRKKAKVEKTYPKQLNSKIQNIKALDRAIFNLHIKINGIFDKDYKELNYNKNKDDDIKRLETLNNLKSEWEKELLYIYLSEIDEDYMYHI